MYTCKISVLLLSWLPLHISTHPCIVYLHVATQQPQWACRMCPLKPAFSTDMFQYSLTMLCSRFRLKGLPGVGSILVHVSKQNKSRHYQKVADVKDHHYE